MRTPTKPGLYWLALDEGGAFTHPDPLLVRVSILQPHDCGRIEFIDFPGFDPQRDFNPLIDSPNHGPVGLASFANGSLHLFRRQEVKLRWIAAVKPPKMPKVPPYVSPRRKPATAPEGCEFGVREDGSFWTSGI